jgi:flagellar biosynthesis GTPase FlhF
MDFLKPMEMEQDQLNEGAIQAAMVRQYPMAAGGLVTRDPFDPAPLLELFEQYHIEIDRMANMAQGLKVIDDASNQNATLLTTQAKQIEKAIEKKRVELKEPYLKVTSVLDSETKRLKDRLILVQKHINSLIAPYLQKKENERREAERKAQMEAARLQAELEQKVAEERARQAEEARLKAIEEGKTKAQAEAEAKQAAAMVEEAPTVVMEAPPELKIQTDAGSARIKEEWAFEIENCAGLPTAAYIARNEQVKAALAPWVSAQVKAGIREISGVRIFKVAKLKTATKRDYKTYEKF